MKSKISFLHTNIRSLKKNFEEFQHHVLSELNFSFTVIGVSETRICDRECGSNFVPELPGYYFESVPTPLSAGGVGLFIDQNCKYRVLERVSNSCFQSLWIEIHLPNNKRSVCGVTYRQHNNANEFLDYLLDFLERQSRHNLNIYIMGDFNIDLLKYATCSYTQTLLQTMQSFSMFPVVDKPTRVYGKSATLIDNIFINNLENNIISGNIVSDTTDHFSQMCILTSQCKIFFPNNKTKVRDYSSLNTKSFNNDLQNINWTSVCQHTDANQSFSRFYKLINKTINKHAPLRCISNRKQKLLAKPWLTAGLRKSIRVKNALFLTYDWVKYKFYRNKIISLTRLSKANYYQSFFDLNMRNARQTWKGINELIGCCKKKNKHNPLNFICSTPNEVPTGDPKEISDILNRYFATVGHKLASKIPQTINTFSDYLDPPLNHTFFFDPIIPEDINLEISTLQDNKAHGLYSSPVKLLKLASGVISVPLATIFNQSICSGIFPSKLKRAKIIPIFKDEDESLPENYRPISLLSIYNRIFEKLVYSRLTKFVKDYNLLYDQQYGFRSKHSTQHAILDIVNTILQNMDNGKFSCGVFIDLKKAFDTVNHEILLAKLENYGVRGVINSWFRSYLTDRKQNTEVNNVVSEAETTLCGVPQGSVLGPLLFLLYINNIYKSSSLFAFYLFADDTSIILANNNLKELESLVNRELGNVNEWLKVNKLSLNIKKSNFVIFRPRQKNIPFIPRIRIFDPVTNTCANLEMKDYVKYLGLMIDSNLSWKYHIEAICHKISKSVGIIAKIRHYVPRRVLLSIYNSLIVPYITYGVCAWGNCALTFQRKIVNLQKRALRLIYFSKSREHAVPFFLKSNCLPLPSLFFRDCSYILYDINRQTAPVSILNHFVKTSHIHNYRTRSVSSESFYVKFSRTDKMYAFFSRIGAQIWNSIPFSIKLLKRSSFRKKIKELLLNFLRSEDDYVEVSGLIKLFNTLG